MVPSFWALGDDVVLRQRDAFADGCESHLPFPAAFSFLEGIHVNGGEEMHPLVVVGALLVRLRFQRLAQEPACMLWRVVLTNGPEKLLRAPPGV
eukprot:CAMPEP_0181490642 /NCGR_PEP_ID=MMETSP1110-20121109/49672_1 /TAXON_ID=174948 /ORGANISM="Symbiodinium sp., Strain CCMP421" /LENGTH=93 /DNA_ID=CAMNT_0023617651 /DNA_START=36 /DNA_END=317 /DNA_ORIENTATION=+